MRRILLAVLVLLVLPLGSGCDLSISRESSAPTPVPPAPPGSACAAVSVAQLQAWMDEKLPRQEQEVFGGVVYLDAPQVVNCAENTAYFQVRIGFQGGGLTVELGLLEDSFDMRYYPDQGSVCLDLHALLSGPGLQPQGVEQVGQQITVAEARSLSISTESMPAEARQRFDQAVGKAAIEGGESQAQGIGTEAAGVLLDWAVGELLGRLNQAIANLVGACIPVE
jgi:hypothetical protein